jgi:hypothetical protein
MLQISVEVRYAKAATEKIPHLLCSVKKPSKKRMKAQASGGEGWNRTNIYSFARGRIGHSANLVDPQVSAATDRLGRSR